MQNTLCILISVHMSQEGPGQIQVNSLVDPEGVVHLTADGHLLPARRRHLGTLLAGLENSLPRPTS